ncbi:MAG: HEAT repeat domain-containing protein, partial [Bryobacteraceae bacterium]|nr:HEAT repeat domain-containing protein [Bryobacteraceae bacterium]
GLLRSQTNLAEVRAALLTAFEQDSDPDVRLRALEGLRAWSGQADIRKALARAVLRDSNPTVRTQAIDLLTQSREPALVGVLQEALVREDNDDVRLKCRQVLHQMKASEETF